MSDELKKKKMKRILIIVLLAVSVTAVGQRFDAAVSAGMNMSQIDGDGAGRYSHVGLRAGVGTSFTLGRDTESPWRMVVELAFAQKGSEINGDSFLRSIDLSYVELPLMLSYNCMKNRLRVAAGVAPAVLVDASVSDDDIENSALQDNYRRVDLLPLTAMVRYRFAERLCLEALYESSMVSISKQEGQGTYRLFRSNKGTFSRVICFGLAWQF